MVTIADRSRIGGGVLAVVVSAVESVERWAMSRVESLKMLMKKLAAIFLTKSLMILRSTRGPGNGSLDPIWITRESMVLALAVLVMMMVVVVFEEESTSKGATRHGMGLLRGWNDDDHDR